MSLAADERDYAIGLELAEALGLPVRPATGRYRMSGGYGEKTAIGLARVVRRILGGPKPLTAAEPEGLRWKSGRATPDPYIIGGKPFEPEPPPLDADGLLMPGPLTWGFKPQGSAVPPKERPERADAEVVDEIGGF